MLKVGLIGTQAAGAARVADAVGLTVDGTDLGLFAPHTIVAALQEIAGVSLVASARGSVLTGKLLGAFVNWSLAKPGRRFGMMLDRSPGCNASSRAPVAEEFAIARGGDIAEEFGRAGRRHVSQSQFIARLTGTSPYYAVCITGHGAEHCLSLGSTWLTARYGYGLAGAKLDARSVETKVLFLNGCSTLRLADSLIPEDLRLSTVLSAAGIAVVGPYRNIRGSQLMERAFVDLVLAGLPVGGIVCELNLLLRDQLAEIPCMVLIGDPCLTLPVEYQSRRQDKSIAWSAARRTTEMAALRNSAEALRRVRDFHASLSICAWSMIEAAAPARAAEMLLRTAGKALAVEIQAPLTLDELITVRMTVEGGRIDLLEAMADDLVAWIGAGRWLQSAYAPVTVPAPPVARTCSVSDDCERGDGTLVDYRFAGLALGQVSVVARECDRCGSRAEWTGDGAAPSPPQVRTEGATVIVEIGELAPNERGRVLLHRCGRTPPAHWPAGGGSLRFDLSGSEVYGRVTVVAFRIGDDHIAVSYAHFFRDPRH
ncbi:hypothetical protein [Rhizobium johnstonii]|uniref:hypothetical protein n=1 Tax=Rhizobium johnstonii TaxID=3019933 RepID=UPI003F996D92